MLGKGSNAVWENELIFGFRKDAGKTFPLLSGNDMMSVSHKEILLVSNLTLSKDVKVVGLIRCTLGVLLLTENTWELIKFNEHSSAPSHHFMCFMRHFQQKIFLTSF